MLNMRFLVHETRWMTNKTVDFGSRTFIHVVSFWQTALVHKDGFTDHELIQYRDYYPIIYMYQTTIYTKKTIVTTWPRRKRKGLFDLLFELCRNTFDKYE